MLFDAVSVVNESSVAIGMMFGSVMPPQQAVLGVGVIPTENADYR